MAGADAPMPHLKKPGSLVPGSDPNCQDRDHHQEAERGGPGPVPIRLGHPPVQDETQGEERRSREAEQKRG
jgi:hypothetical protein